MLESSISISAAAHVAVAKSNIIRKIDLDGPSLCQYDPVVCGVNFNNAEITISDSLGLGIVSIKNLQCLEF